MTHVLVVNTGSSSLERWTSQNETEDLRRFIDQLPTADRLAFLGVRVSPAANKREPD